MDVRAIIIIAPPGDPAAAENIAGVPIGLFDVLGKPVLLRVIDRLRKFGIAHVSVVAEVGPAAQPFARTLPADLPVLQATNGDVWRSAENAFCEHAHAGADLVLVLRLGPYSELDCDELVQFHLDQGSRTSWVLTPEGAPLDIVAITSSRRNDAAFLFRHRLRQFRTPAAKYVFRGYVNPLRDGADLRHLACDSFVSRTGILPDGAEIRPGVWLAPGARVQRGARILAPAYIGPYAKVRAAAVITRGSVLEHHAVVDCGTVVEDSTVLPYTYVGAGLDVAHAVVGCRHFLHLRRGVQTEIADARLLSTVSAHAPLRALGQAVSLATFLPAQILRGLFAKSQREAPAQLPAAVQVPSPAINTPAELQPAETSEAQFPSTLAVARRYGDQ